jgi:hypothetical protein
MVGGFGGLRRFRRDLEALCHAISCIFMMMLERLISSLFSCTYWQWRKVPFRAPLFSITYWDQPAFLTFFCVNRSA